MPGMPNGFKESVSCGVLELYGIGIGNWSGRDSTKHQVELFTTDLNPEVLVAHCLVGQLAKLSDREIGRHELNKYEDMLFRMAYLIATDNFGTLGKLQAPKYKTPPILYYATHSERVWGIHTSVNVSGSGKLPLLALIARAPKAKEAHVMSILSNSTRH